MSKWLLLSIPHVLGIIILLSVDAFPLMLKVFLIILIVLSFSYYLRLHLVLTSKKSVLFIKQDSAKNWFITFNSKPAETELISVKLLPSSFISRFLIVLNYQDSQDTKHSILITKDSCYSNEFRYLMIAIKLANIK